jgi:hypothetical protein
VLAAGGYRTVKETVHKLSAGGTSDRYRFDCPAGQRRHVCITPSGAGAQLLLRLYTSGGALVQEAQTTGDPANCTVASASLESFAYEVSASHAPFPNFPFLVTVFAEGPA